MNWKNSSFQVAAFVVGKCHTADEAYRKLLLLREEREGALRASKIGALRVRAVVLKAEETFKTSNSEWERLEAQATLEEVEAGRALREACIEEAEREVVFINDLIARITPLRKYAHLPDHQAFQAVQREEWCLELLERAQNYLYCTGTIPTDHFATMRSHPDFATTIRPLVAAMHLALRNKDTAALAKFTVVPEFMRVLTSANVFGPHPDVRQLVRAIRELDAPVEPEAR